VLDDDGGCGYSSNVSSGSGDVSPRHIGLIMDGNGRWAERRGLPRLSGHREGLANAHRVVEALLNYGIGYVTLYVFSTENWRRPREEVEGIFRILEEGLPAEVEFACEKGIRIRHLGKLDGLPSGLRDVLGRAVELTKNGEAMVFGLALNYGARGEMVEAVRRLVRDGVKPSDVDEAVFSQRLYTSGMPAPDLIIRTGGEMRLSNFLLWQAAYAEFYFTPVLWPDFDRAEIDQALSAYRKRQRRFGGLSSSG